MTGSDMDVAQRPMFAVIVVVQRRLGANQHSKSQMVAETVRHTHTHTHLHRERERQADA